MGPVKLIAQIHQDPPMWMGFVCSGVTLATATSSCVTHSAGWQERAETNLGLAKGFVPEL